MAKGGALSGAGGDVDVALALSVLEAADAAGIGVTAVWVDADAPDLFLWNDALLRLTGYTREEMRALGPYGSVPADQLPTMKARFARRAAGRDESPHYESALMHKDGRRVEVEFSPVVVHIGGRRAVVTFVRDLTELKRSTAALARSERTLRALIQSAPDPVAVVQGGRVVLANPALARLVGRDDPSSLVGFEPLDAIDPSDHAAYRARTVDAAAGRRVEPRAYKVAGPGGASLMLEWRSTAIEYDGAPALLAIGRDVTERLALEVQLAQADRMVALGTLAAGVAHEINNPLTFMLLRLEQLHGALSRDAPPPSSELRAALAELREGAERVRDTVSDLRAFARPSEHARGPVDLSAVAEAAARFARHLVTGRLTLERDLGEVELVLGDAGRLEQVVMNLLTNAAHALNERGGTIRLRTWSEGGRTRLEVRDDGPGVPDEALGRIFEPFFTTKPRGEGLGLGLSICHRIVGEHGGSLRARNVEGGGASFVVDLPSAPLGTTSAPPASPAPAPAPAKRLRALVVDDEVVIANLLRAMLAPYYDVEVATRGEDARRMLREGAPFDVVLCDMMMPGVSGIDLIEELEAEGSPLASRVVVMTGGAFVPRATAFLARDDHPVLEKPFTLDDVLRVVRELVDPPAG